MNTGDEQISVSADAGICTVKLNRPEAKNALTRAMRAELCDALRRAELDPTVKAVLMSATDPAFCAGVDFKEPADPSMDPFTNQASSNPGRVLRAMHTPVICAVNGACVSGGLELALSCSFIVASERAWFADTHAKLGVVPGWGLTALLPRAVGTRRARELSATGRPLTAEEAASLGMVNHVIAHDSLMEAASGLAAEITDTAAVTEIMALYNRCEGLSLAEALSLEADHVAHRRFEPAAFIAAGRSLVGRKSATSDLRGE